MNQVTGTDGWTVTYDETTGVVVYTVEGGTVVPADNGEWAWTNTAEGYSGTTASLSFAKALAAAK